MSGYWPMTEAANGTPLEPQIDRDAARALVEAGYMPLADYIAIYGLEETAQPGKTRATAGNDRRKAPPRRGFMHPKRLRRLTLRKRKAG